MKTFTVLMPWIAVCLLGQTNASTVIRIGGRKVTSLNGTMAPTSSSSVSSIPSLSPSKGSSYKPSLSHQPSFKPMPSLNPTTISKLTESPTRHPSVKASIMPTKSPRRESMLTFFFKLIGWIIFMGLSIVLFGMCMSYRYHLYYFLLQSWYIIRRSSILRRLRYCFSRNPSSESEILFDQGDPLEGLLLRQRDS